MTDAEPPQRPQRWALTVVLTLLLAVLSWYALAHRPSPPGGPAVAATARAAAITFFTFDPTNPDATADQVLAMSTGQFRTDYERQSGALIGKIRQRGLEVTANVPDDGVAVEYLDRDRAQVLVLINTSTKAGTSAAEPGTYRTRVVLSRVGGSWLLSGLESVG